MLLTRSILSYIKTSDEEQIVLGTVRAVHLKLCAHFSVKQSQFQCIEKLKNYIEKLVELGVSLDNEQIFDSLIYAYQERNRKYPSDFTMRLALEYMQNHHSTPSQSRALKENVENSTQAYSIHQHRNKILDIEKHLERISLVKFQLTKNLKELQGQGDSHLWIDHDFIDPAKETLEASLAQVQDIENRMLVLKETYEDYVG